MASKEAFERIKSFLGSNYCYELREQIEAVEKGLEQVEFLERKNDDLWETLKALSKNATIKKDRMSGTEITITIKSWEDNFDKIAWVFGCQRR